MNNIDLELYKYFYEVGKTKNITKAANALYVSQPAITQHIKKLESELNCSLFYRTKSGVEFTKEGEELFNAIQNSIISLECAPTTLNKFKEDDTNIRFASSFGGAKVILSKVISKILKQYPNTNVSLDVLPNEKIVEGLMNNSIDIGLITTNTMNKDNILYKKCMDIERVFMASKEFVEKNKIKSITKENINKYPFIPTAKGSSTRVQFDEFLAKNNITLVPKLDLSPYDLRLEYMLKGHGIALFNKQYASDLLKEGKLVEIKSDIKFPNKTIYIAMNKNNENNQFVKKIINIIKQ